MTDFYRSVEPSLKKEKEAVDILNRRRSALRLLFFVLFISLSVLGFIRDLSIPFFAASLIFLILFVAVVVLHGKSQKEALLISKKIEANSRYIARTEGNFEILTDGGDEFINPMHPFSSDLDMFGNHSVFSLYNISHSCFGRRAFADMLNLKHFNDLEQEYISRTQEIVSSLSSDPEFLLDYEATADVFPVESVPGALMDLCLGGKTLPPGLKLLYKFLPLIWIFPAALFAAGFGKAVRISVLLCIFINLILWFAVSLKNYSALFKTSKITKQAESAAQRLSVILSSSQKDKLIPSLIDEDFKNVLDELMKACSLCAFRDQPVTALILNALMPFDILCADKLFSWSAKNGDSFVKNLDGLGTSEALMCAAVPGLIHEHTCLPSIEYEKKAFFDGKDMVHPLLNPSKAVSNSVKIESKTALITGSNMSGKTTLIRTVGTILVLSYIGARVPAFSVRASIMDIRTSMRITDSIEENMSTFKAELIRIGSIVKASKKGIPLLFLIDEVFRGTNSKDRTDGALILLKNLSKPYIAGFMTTHDYALCDSVLAGDLNANTEFFHFSERYEGDGIIFDYKLRDGMSHESNARFLMKLAGID